jgi:hypothetical protein
MPPARQPWPMKWIVLAIVLFLVPYTFITLHFRKPGPGYLPYQDSKQRASLAKVGYQRVTLSVDRPADPRPIAAVAPVVPAAGGLPPDLTATLLTPPILPTAIGAVAAAPTADGGPYRITFSCTRADNHEDLATAALYLKGSEIVIVTDCEHLPGELLTRSRAEVITLNFSSGALPVGTYHVTLAGANSGKSWTLQVH